MILETLGQCLIEKRRADDLRQDLADISQPFERVSQCRFVDVRLKGYDPLANRLVDGQRVRNEPEQLEISRLRR